MTKHATHTTSRSSFIAVGLIAFFISQSVMTVRRAYIAKMTLFGIARRLFDQKHLCLTFWLRLSASFSIMARKVILREIILAFWRCFNPPHSRGLSSQSVRFSELDGVLCFFKPRDGFTTRRPRPPPPLPGGQQHPFAARGN